MVEMTETARILNTATPRSVVILDEIGRGTSTYDGLSLAWSIVEHIHDHIGCRTLFATHYHELTDLEEQLPGVRNFNVAVKEWDNKVMFLHQIVPGPADKSYGIHVAQLAGVPRAVNERAREVLELLESQHRSSERVTNGGAHDSFCVGRQAESRDDKFGLAADAKHSTPRADGGHWQLTLFGLEDHPLLEEIRATDLDGIEPQEALELAQSWQRQLIDERVPAKR